MKNLQSFPNGDDEDETVDEEMSGAAVDEPIVLVDSGRVGSDREEEVDSPKKSSRSHTYENGSYLSTHKTSDVGQPPTPAEGATPLAVVADKWHKYIDDITGRPYFYHPETRMSRWKPPRQLVSFSATILRFKS